MKVTILSDICEISSGGTPSRSIPSYYKGEIPWAKISDIENAENGVVFDTEEKISLEGLKSIRNKLFPKGTLLFAMYGSIGKVAIAGRELSTNQAILGIRPKKTDEVNLKYLKMWFERNKQRLISQGRGVALQNRSATIIRKIKIPLPPLDDQIRIATVLTQAEKLIAKRKESIAMLDELLKSTFLDMFGDPVRNEKGWEIVSIKELCSKVIDCPHNTPQYSGILTDLYCIRSADIQNGYLEFNNTLQVDVHTFNQRNVRHIPSYNDIVFTREGGRLGNCARVPRDVKICLGQRIMLFVVDSSIATSEFLWALLNTNSLQQCISNLAGGGAAPRVNIKDFIKIECFCPPHLLQNQFTSIVKKIESLKEKYTQSLTELENLYGSLSQRAFKGELDLSKVSLVYETETEVEEIEMTGSVDVELKTKLEFTNKDLITLIKNYSGKTFSFDELWEEIEKDADKKIPSRKSIQDQIIELLESDKGRLQQVFNIPTSQADKKNIEKQIAFRGYYED